MPNMDKEAQTKWGHNPESAKADAELRKIPPRGGTAELEVETPPSGEGTGEPGNED